MKTIKNIWTVNKTARAYNKELLVHLMDLMNRVDETDVYIERDLKKIARKIALRIQNLNKK